MTLPPPVLSVSVTLPDWVTSIVDFDAVYGTDRDRMRLAVRLSRENVERGTGGPFGAAVFERQSGRLVAVGVNEVMTLRNSTVHAEMVALQCAEQRVRSYSLHEARAEHDLFTSCAPCAMCLGATLWSGVTRLVAAADREDAERAAFDEGPVFAESYAYLRARGITVVRGFLREEAAAVIEQYRRMGGVAYNG
jgi:tRNA(Arg) A34 adenosine deaminase TadA